MNLINAGAISGSNILVGSELGGNALINAGTIVANILANIFSQASGGGGGGSIFGGLGALATLGGIIAAPFTGGTSMAAGSLVGISTAYGPQLLGSYHQGGIVYAHQGYSNLRHDEVPAILKTGERVLTREQNRAYEGRGGGNGRGGIIINVTHAPAYHYRPTEADYKRDARQIVKAINQEIGKYGQRMGNGQI
jgi:hypothetical protein